MMISRNILIFICLHISGVIANLDSSNVTFPLIDMSELPVSCQNMSLLHSNFLNKLKSQSLVCTSASNCQHSNFAHLYTDLFRCHSWYLSHYQSVYEYFNQNLEEIYVRDQAVLSSFIDQFMLLVENNLSWVKSQAQDGSVILYKRMFHDWFSMKSLYKFKSVREAKLQMSQYCNDTVAFSSLAVGNWKWFWKSTETPENRKKSPKC